MVLMPHFIFNWSGLLKSIGPCLELAESSFSCSDKGMSEYFFVATLIDISEFAKHTYGQVADR